MSRRFIARTQAQPENFLLRPLGDLDFPVRALESRVVSKNVPEPEREEVA